MQYTIPEAYKDKTRQFVALISLKYGDRFYTMNHDNPETLQDGTIAYAVLGYFDAPEEFASVAFCDAAQEFYWDICRKIFP